MAFGVASFFGRLGAPRGRALAALGVGGALLGAALLFRELVDPRLATRIEPSSADLLLARGQSLGLALVALAAVFGSVARLTTLRGGALAALALATTPAFFVHSRSATPDMASMASFALVMAGAALGVAREGEAPAVRALGAALAAAGLALGARRFGVVVVGAPLAAGAASAAASRLGGETPRLAWPARVGVALGLALSVAALVAATRGTAAGWLLGAGEHRGAPATFDVALIHVGYTLIPWAIAIPLAAASGLTGAGGRFLALASAFGLGAHALATSRGATSPLAATPAVVAWIGAALAARDDRPRAAPTLAGVAALALAVVVGRDLQASPERIGVALGAVPPAELSAHAEPVVRALRVGAAGAAVVVIVALFAPRVGLARGVVAFAGLVAIGLGLRVAVYPALLRRLSPGEAYEVYARARRPGEALGVLGVDRAALGGVAVVPLTSAGGAADWLAGAATTRRYVAVSRPELARLNAEVRARRGGNVAVLAGEGASVLLAVSRLEPGESSVSPFDRIVLGAPPPGLRPAGVTFGDRLTVVGWRITSPAGKPLAALEARTPARLQVVLRVAGSSPLRGYCTFLHVDHTPVRYAFEQRTHAYPMDLWRDGDVIVDDLPVDLPAHFGKGRYAAHFGVGELPCNDDRRMPVTSGGHDGHDRAQLGALEVR